jgi:ADP-heptose:LPS heptosyltransferase
MVDRLMRVASAFGADVAERRFSLPPNPAAVAWAEERLASVPRPRLVLNVGARWTTKRWPPEHFATLARRAHDTFGVGLIAVGAPEDRPLVERLGQALDGVPLLDLAGKTDLPQLAAVSGACDLFLSNDTGPLHLAVAAGARVIGVFTCSDPAKTGPYGPKAQVVRTCVWCAGSLIRQCARMECMIELSPDRAWPALCEQLGRAPDERSSAA